MIRCKSSFFSSLSSCSVTLSSITCSLLVINGTVVFSESQNAAFPLSVCLDRLLTNIHELSPSSLLPFIFTYKGRLLLINSYKRFNCANMVRKTNSMDGTGRWAVQSGVGWQVAFGWRALTVARLSWQVGCRLSEYQGGVSAVEALGDKQTFLVRGESAAVVN